AGPGAPRGGEILLQLRDLCRHRAGAVFLRRAVELARALRAEQSALDRRAGAGERQERHRDMRVLHRERERGAQLVTVERAVARLTHPARAEPRPFGEVFRRAVLFAGAVALEGRAAGAEIFAARAEAAEAEAFV